MLNTLYRRLVVSHVIPLLLVVPLMGVAFVYALETQVLLPNVAYEATGQAALVAEIAAGQPDVWVDPAQAQALVDRVAPRLTARLMLLDRRGRLLASSNPADKASVGQRMDVPDLPAALGGNITVRTAYGQESQSEAADVLVPLVGSDGQVVGLVRVLYQQSGVFQQFQRVRWLVIGVLAVGLAVGALVGWLLAVNLSRPLRRVTGAVYRLASGERLEPLAEEGPHGDAPAGAGGEQPGGPPALAGGGAPAPAGQPGARAGPPAGRPALGHPGPGRRRRRRSGRCAASCWPASTASCAVCSGCWRTWPASTIRCWGTWSWAAGPLPSPTGCLPS